MLRRLPWPIIILSFTLVLAGAGTVFSLVLQYQQSQTPSRLDQPGEPLPALELKAHNGDLIDVSKPPGRVTVVDFSLTRCELVCPVLNQRMATLQQAIQNNDDLAGMKLVSIAVDPDHDSPEVLAEFAKGGGVDPTIWRFATTDRATLWPYLEANFGVGVSFSADPEKDGTPVVHSAKLMLLDELGRIRAHYNGLDPKELPILIADAKRLLK